MRWLKVFGIAGLVGLAATGAVVVSRRRSWEDYDATEISERLHRRLQEAVEEAGVIDLREA
ncbi:MAG: hypothetical protein S0880_19095 [Actinomycetota bacterium]|nr:hypothetical protein [Actinomycetota bacterium]